MIFLRYHRHCAAVLRFIAGDSLAASVKNRAIVHPSKSVEVKFKIPSHHIKSHGTQQHLLYLIMFATIIQEEEKERFKLCYIEWDVTKNN